MSLNGFSFALTDVPENMKKKEIFQLDLLSISHTKKTVHWICNFFISLLDPEKFWFRKKESLNFFHFVTACVSEKICAVQ